MSDTAYFELTDDIANSPFVIKLNDPSKIEHARRIVRGEETAAVHVSGTIVSETADYNPAWSFHLEADSIAFFELAMEVCDAAIEYVESHLLQVGSDFLPGSHWCPWSSRLVREVQPVLR